MSFNNISENQKPLTQLTQFKTYTFPDDIFPNDQNDPTLIPLEGEVCQIKIPKDCSKYGTYSSYLPNNLAAIRTTDEYYLKIGNGKSHLKELPWVGVDLANAYEAYPYSNESARIIPKEGQICVIKVSFSDEQLPDFPIPQSFLSDNGSNKQYIKIGDGQTNLADLPWTCTAANDYALYTHHFTEGSTIPRKGQICIIKVEKQTQQSTNIPLPPGCFNVDYVQYLLKVGDGKTTIANLPWIGTSNSNHYQHYNYKDFSENRDLFINEIPLKGQICTIFVPANSYSLVGFPLPVVIEQSSQDSTLLKIGDGETNLAKLPWTCDNMSNDIANFSYNIADADVIPRKGQICIIQIPKYAQQIYNFPIPQELLLENETRYYIKIGDGKTNLGNLEWLGINTVNDYSFQHYHYADPKQILRKGQICIIQIEPNTPQSTEFPLPTNGVNVGYTQTLLKIGNGTTALAYLPWIGISNSNIYKSYDYNDFVNDEWLPINEIPVKGQICVINVPAGADSLKNISLPYGTSSSTTDQHLLKIGNGKDNLKTLPWVGSSSFQQVKTYVYPNGKDIIPLQGEICQIEVPRWTDSLSDFLLPPGADQSNYVNHFLKIGDGKTTLANLPWVTADQLNQIKEITYRNDTSIADIILNKGQIGLINVRANSTSYDHLPLPKGAENLPENKVYLKIGNGTANLLNLPWIGADGLTQYKEYTYPEGATYVPLKGEICQILIEPYTIAQESYNLPSGAENQSFQLYFYKIGNGKNNLQSLPWIGPSLANAYRVISYTNQNQSAIKNIVPQKGELIVINVAPNIKNDTDFPLPEGCLGGTEVQHFLKIGTGNTALGELPWVGGVVNQKGYANQELLDEFKMQKTNSGYSAEIILNCN